MLEISGEDIIELNDSDLRSLIALLCEAELRMMDLPTVGVTWGGHQDAKDGGIDVRVELTTSLPKEGGFVPRAQTGFQVKKPDMPPGAIETEMRPKDGLRQVIKDLADNKGAYIIVSSQGSTTDSALKSRKKAMEKALSDYPNNTNIKLDFYDRVRIASWVRNHPSLVLWVRDKIGRPIQGWRPYGNWGGSPHGMEEEYILDEHIRLYNDSNPRLDGLSTIDGINELRNKLHHPGSSVRLVGLSGVGKTRLLQALFDERIGEKPLNQSLVFYTDMGDSPNPDPRSFAERIIAIQKPAILAIDNCPPELHRRLTSLCSASGSLVSLITVEYDVREDQPEETDVIRLEPASSKLIEKVILARFTYINEEGARSIAKFSGGNARIAIALGKTIKRGENLSELRDSELFNRLFHQRNAPDRLLLRAAEACSLVYSFNNQNVQDPNTELKLLGSLVNMSIGEIFENVSELRRRDLVQQRSVWRAVLPHAIANKLAQRALENIPLEKICDVFEKNGSERLLKSFSRRLSYLHECEPAIEISRRWLEDGGLLGDVSNLNRLGIDLLNNIAPVNPELTLSAIERVSTKDNAQYFYSRDNTYYKEITDILRALAYDKNLFVRSTELICRFALSEKPDENYNSIRNLLKSLFHIRLSGTHASAEQRLLIIKQLFESNSQNQIELGLSLLEATLESWGFSSYHNYEFGARPRDYGFSPTKREDINRWFKLFIDYSVTLAVSHSLAAPKAKELLAKSFRGLWIKAGMYDELENASRVISSKSFWGEGWLAVRTTKRYDNEDMSTNIYERLNTLDTLLKPTSLIDRARVYALSENRFALDLEDVISDEHTLANSENYDQVEIITQSLGKEVGSNTDIFKELLPEIISNNGSGLFTFGQGLAEGCTNHEEMWRNFSDQLLLIEESKRQYQVIRGFLNKISELDTRLSAKMLDESVRNEPLANVYPWLQTSVEIKGEDIKRLKYSLEYGVAPIIYYKYLGYGRINKNIDDSDLSELLRIMSTKPNGTEIAVDILHMRLNRYLNSDITGNSIPLLGQELLLKYEFSRKDKRVNKMERELATIVDTCFRDKSAKDTARDLCNKLVKAFISYDIYSMDYSHVLNALAKRQPWAFLDEFLGNVTKLDYKIEQALRDESNALSQIDDELIINWCEFDPKIRYPILASAIRPYQKNNETNTLQWTTLASRIINDYDNPIFILNKFKSSFFPHSWSGSLAEKLQTRLVLISNLKKHENLSIVEWANTEEQNFKEAIRSERENELKHEKKLNERFE